MDFSERLASFKEENKSDLSVLGHVEFSAARPQDASVSVIQVRVYVKGEKINTVQFARNWWQAFRQRWFPSFWLVWYPVKTVTWKTYIHYPDVALDERPDLETYSFYSTCVIRAGEEHTLDSKLAFLLVSIESIVLGEIPRGGRSWRVAIYRSDFSRGYADFN